MLSNRSHAIRMPRNNRNLTACSAIGPVIYNHNNRVPIRISRCSIKNTLVVHHQCPVHVISAIPGMKSGIAHLTIQIVVLHQRISATVGVINAWTTGIINGMIRTNFLGWGKQMNGIKVIGVLSQRCNLIQRVFKLGGIVSKTRFLSLSKAITHE